MQFNSYIFILLFLPLVVAGYFLISKINKNAGKIFVALSGALFYGYGNWEALLILAASIGVNYGMSLFIRKNKSRGLLITGIILNTLLLFLFKYINFSIENINTIFKTDIQVMNIILPLAISFYTFQQIMYLVNVYNGSLKYTGFCDYVFYIMYFPKLLMGPVTEPEMLLEQVNTPEKSKLNTDNLAFGIKIFSLGLFKKVIIADTFARAVNAGFSGGELSSLDWILVMLFYTIQIYFDFSGYTDMATGVSLMLNIELGKNFDSPYKAVSVRDFWKRWHISLTGFFTRYIYIPLGGSKNGSGRTYLNTMIIFLISGIWHGANWTFIIWGAVYGILCCVERMINLKRNKLIDAVTWLPTFATINVLWLLFRADSVKEFAEIIKKIISFDSFSLSKDVYECFGIPETNVITGMLHLEEKLLRFPYIWMIIATAAALIICFGPKNNYEKLKDNNWFYMIVSALAFAWSFLALGSESVFVYFNF